MNNGLDQRKFLEAWAGEFARAIEMFSGSSAQAEFIAAPGAADRASVGDYFWWKQEFEGKNSARFVTWIGAIEAAWSALGAAMADAGSDAKQIYLELLGQAEQGAATLLTRRVGQEVRSQTGVNEEPPAETTGFGTWEVKVQFGESDIPPLRYLIDPSQADALTVTAPSASAEERPKTTEMSAPEPSYDARVDQFLNLNLPLSVVLGRSVLQLHDVLKLTSGSVVELDSTVLDRVEVIVHGKLVARGEVVSIKGNYGVRITDLVADKGAWASDLVASGGKADK